MELAGGYDYAAALKEFEESRAGVRGLIESGITTVPPLFRSPNPPLPPAGGGVSPISIPTIDFSLPRALAVDLVRAAARDWGFFQVTNHGVPIPALDGAISAVRSFHELPRAVRSEFYARTPVGGVAYYTNPPGQSNTTLAWRDTLHIRLRPARPDLDRVPPVCREELLAYEGHMAGLGKTLLGLLSEGLGVGTDKLQHLMCLEGSLMVCHYYPPCPEPDRTTGGVEHTDPSVFTVLLQDAVGGLQVRREGVGNGEGCWVDAQPVPGALVINIGDVLKVISNDEYKSVEHRVVIKSRQDARVSIALFFNPAKRDDSDLFAPLPELLSAENPARYRSFTIPEFIRSRREIGHGKLSVRHFKVVERLDEK